ncbi:tetraspanin-9 [Harmonia axyridis]|uniref:tetraspanin-9 n=1 Tax=Harmonia axyridis TaxID=115357 RepID=UPI001E2750C1|nr:tetraspanin-9 [Harmonia axyridis]XP_045479530.1 tetraspanin-9 [Harmonia axyridis]
MSKSGYTCVRLVFCWLNVFLWVTACILLGLGVWLRLSHEGLVTLVPQYDYLSLDIIFMGIGTLAFSLTFLGCCGSLFQNRCMLIMYFVLVILLLVAEIICGTTIFVFREGLNHFVREDLKNGIMLHYNASTGGPFSLPKIWDRIQLQFRCCGVDSYEDWYLIGAWPKERWVPDSCCLPAVREKGCGRTDADNWYEGGCYQPIYAWFLNRLTTLGVVGLIVTFLQLYGMISAMLLFCTIKHKILTRKYKSYKT